MPQAEADLPVAGNPPRLTALLLCTCLQEEHSPYGGSLAYQRCVQALTFRRAQLQVHQLQQLGFQEYQAIAAVQVSQQVCAPLEQHSQGTSPQQHWGGQAATSAAC